MRIALGRRIASGNQTGKRARETLTFRKLSLVPIACLEGGNRTVERIWGLDKRTGMLRMGIISIMQACNHARTEILARRDGVDYVRCLDCDQVFEAEDLEPVPAYDEDEKAAS
jgi:hypothetical protein